MRNNVGGVEYGQATLLDKTELHLPQVQARRTVARGIWQAATKLSAVLLRCDPIRRNAWKICG
jgi:hypothetical protein